MQSPLTNQARQRDDVLYRQTLAVPAGGSIFMKLGGGIATLERDTDGFAALAAAFFGAIGVTFRVIIHEYITPGAFIDVFAKTSVANPSGTSDIVNITRPITNKYLAIEIEDLSGLGGLVICSAKLRPISCYDPEVEVIIGPDDVFIQKNLLGVTTTHYNGAAAGASQAMFAANANRLEVVGINIGRDPIHVAFGVAAVWGAGQYVRPGGDFRFDRTSLAINFIDNGGGATVSATEFSTP